MATWTGLGRTQDVLNSAMRWKEQCLLRDGSVFSDSHLWVGENLRTLEKLIADNLLPGPESFYDKLEVQIGDAAPEIQQLAAKAVWFLLLVDSGMRSRTKLERISRVWALSGTGLPESSHPPDQSLLGLVKTGQGYHLNLWIERKQEMKSPRLSKPALPGPGQPD